MGGSNQINGRADASRLSVADRSTSRSINQKALVDIIYRSNGVHKAALAKDLGLSKPAVSDNVAELIALGLVEERGSGESGKNGGRRPIILHFNKSLSYIGALDLSLREPVCAIGDLGNWVHGLKKININRDAPAEEKRKCITDTFLELLAEHNIPQEKMEIIVISHPGILGNDNEPLHVVESFHAWTDINIKSHLEQQFGIPVLLENDNNLAAVGEMHLGHEEMLQNLIYISCGTGLGAGVIINGELYKGFNRAAGEMGFVLDSNGNRIEDAVSIDGLLRRIGRSLDIDTGQEKLTFSKVVEMAGLGNPMVNQCIREVGREIGRIIYNYSVLMDIPTIVFGGDYLKLGQALLDGIEEAIPETFYFKPRVVKSILMESASIFGGFVLGKDEILQRKLLAIK